jgi:excisionase family DNA binding protein
MLFHLTFRKHGDKLFVMVKFYTIKEVAEMLKVSKQTIYRLMKDEKIIPTRLGKRTLFKESELNRFVESLDSNKE